VHQDHPPYGTALGDHLLFLADQGSAIGKCASVRRNRLFRRRADLGRQPSLGIGPHSLDFPRTSAQAEAMHRNGGFQRHGDILAF
jgi:hypothetical protein